MNGKFSKMKLLLKKILFRYIDIENIIEKHLNVIKEIEWGKTLHWSQMACADNGAREFCDMEDFAETILLPFELHNFCVMNGYDSVLRKNFGNYMELPPKSERHPKQDYIKFYWKNGC